MFYCEPGYLKNFRIAECEVLKFSKELESEIGKNFYLKFLGNQVRLHFNDIKFFSEAKIAFQKAGLSFHTFALPSEKPFTTILKGLPMVDTESIASELQLQKLNPTNVVAFKSSPSNSLYKITFPQVQSCPRSNL